MNYKIQKLEDDKQMSIQFGAENENRYYGRTVEHGPGCRVGRGARRRIPKIQKSSPEPASFALRSPEIPPAA